MTDLPPAETIDSKQTTQTGPTATIIDFLEYKNKKRSQEEKNASMVLTSIPPSIPLSIIPPVINASVAPLTPEEEEKVEVFINELEDVFRSVGADAAADLIKELAVEDGQINPHETPEYFLYELTGIVDRMNYKLIGTPIEAAVKEFNEAFEKFEMTIIKNGNP